MTALPEKRNYTIEDIESLPEGQRAELIAGELYMLSAPTRIHQRIISQLTKVIGVYIDNNNGKCEVYPSAFDVRLFNDDSIVVQPDISVICDPDKLTDKGCSGAPDWIIEIVSPSSLEHDYYRKQMLYQAAGVKEYWIINPMEKKTSVFFYPTVYSVYDFTEEITVNIYPGFSIKIGNLL